MFAKKRGLDIWDILIIRAIKAHDINITLKRINRIIQRRNALPFGHKEDLSFIVHLLFGIIKLAKYTEADTYYLAIETSPSQDLYIEEFLKDRTDEEKHYLRIIHYLKRLIWISVPTEDWPNYRTPTRFSR